MYHSTPYFTVSQVGVNYVEITSQGMLILLRPQDAIELANEIIRQGVKVPAPDKPGREIDLKEVGLPIEQAKKGWKVNPPPA